MNMLHYNEYINSRINNGSPISSDFETVAAFIVDTHSPKESFAFYLLTNDECYECTCEVREVNHQNRFMIKTIYCFNHNLATVYNGKTIPDAYNYAYIEKDNTIIHEEYYSSNFEELAEYNEQVRIAIGNVIPSPPISTIHLKYLVGKYTDINAVRYALQTKIGNNVRIEVPERENCKNRVLFSKSTLSKRINLSLPNISIMDIIRQEWINLYVPNDSDTLASKFIDDKSWEDILPQDCSRCLVGNVECFYLSIKLEIDAFNNIFCVAKDSECKTKRSLLVNAFNASIQTEIMVEDRDDEEAEESEVTHQKLNDICESFKGSSSEQYTEIVKTDDSFEQNASIRLESKCFTINDGDIYNYYDLFGEYLYDIEEIRIEDPYIRTHHQFNNLRNLVSTSIQVNNETNGKLLRKLHLVTVQPTEGYYHNKDFVDKDKAIQQQKDKLELLSQELSSAGIVFSYEFWSEYELHDRCLILSNGWYISIGRGLDIFNSPKNKFAERTCKRTHVSITRIEDMASIKRKKREKRR